MADARLLPVDIVWAIDGSGSMVGAFPAIQAALNQFSQQVEGAGLDAHIVLLTTQQLCIPAPLGSGSCGAALGPGGLLPPGLGTGAPVAAPDSKAPRLLHLDVSFGYGEGMGVLLDSFPHYKQQLRSGARTHLVLTEDGAPPMPAEAVVEHIEGRTSATGSPPWMPALAPDSWVFSGVLCLGGGGLTCALSLIPPTTTISLIEMSGGVSANLGTVDQAGADPFAELVEELAKKVIVGAELSCEYDIPKSPDDRSFDRGLVNVRYGVGGTDKQLLPRKMGACADAEAWRYDDDDAPTKILLCPRACELVRAQADTELNVEFGCETIVI